VSAEILGGGESDKRGGGNAGVLIDLIEGEGIVRYRNRWYETQSAQ